MARKRRRPHTVTSLLRDGRWGHLRPGISRQVLVAHLGQPDRWQPSQAELQAQAAGQPIAGWALSQLLRYGAVEFHFPEDPAGGCWMIFCDDLDHLAGRFTADGLAEGMTLDQVGTWLQQHGLAWQQQPFPQAPDQLRLVLESGAKLGLVDDDDFFDQPGSGHRLFCVEVQGDDGQRGG